MYSSIPRVISQASMSHAMRTASLYQMRRHLSNRLTTFTELSQLTVPVSGPSWEPGVDTGGTVNRAVVGPTAVTCAEPDE
jgi:hypothetical protein